MLNFSWATDLDPKGANNHIKDAIDRRYVTDDDDEDPSIDSSVCKFQLFIYIFVAKSFTVLYCNVLRCIVLQCIAVYCIAMIPIGIGLLPLNLFHLFSTTINNVTVCWRKKIPNRYEDKKKNDKFLFG